MDVLKKQQFSAGATVNEYSAWSKIIQLVRQDAEREKDLMHVRLLLSLSVSGDDHPDDPDQFLIIIRERFGSAVQQLIDSNKTKVLTQYFLALFQRNQSWSKWPDENRSRSVYNTAPYFHGTKFGSAVRPALTAAMLEAATEYCPGLNPIRVEHLLDEQ